MNTSLNQPTKKTIVRCRCGVVIPQHRADETLPYNHCTAKCDKGCAGFDEQAHRDHVVVVEEEAENDCHSS